MEYRDMGRNKEKPSFLGFGAMRLPVLSDGSIDKFLAKRMIDTAYKNGINYFDTAYPYHGGKSETFLGEALSEYSRDSFFLASKFPIWYAENVGDAKRIFEEQLSKLKTDYFDFYLLHALGEEYWQKMCDIGVVDYFEEEQKNGRIKNYGFSFHDKYEAFSKIIKARKWDFCQVQFNYMDTEHQAGEKGILQAERLDIPVVVMEPVKGGSLAKLPEDINNIYKSVNSDWTPASWALRFVAEYKNVRVILSGMSNMEQLEENLSTFNNLRPLTVNEKQAIREVRDEFSKRTNNSCTNCRYCMPCPSGVDIPRCFELWNDYSKYRKADFILESYYKWTDAEEHADRCTECGQCETKCPQHITIIEDLKKVDKLMVALNDGNT